MIKKDSIVISEKDFLELMQRAFDEGYKGYQEARDSVVYTLIDEWKATNKQVLNATTKWAIAQSETEAEVIALLQNAMTKSIAQSATATEVLQQRNVEENSETTLRKQQAQRRLWDEDLRADHWHPNFAWVFQPSDQSHADGDEMPETDDNPLGFQVHHWRENE
jgi:hypothetical protein